MPSDLWYRKMRSFFCSLDYDGSGILTTDDITGMVAKFTEYSGIKDEEELKECRRKIHKYWEIIFQGKTSMTYKGFVKGYEHLLIVSEKDPRQAQDYLNLYVNTIFDLIDKDHGGHWTLADLKLYLEIKCRENFDRAEAVKLFKKLDANNDNMIDKSEFYELVRSYLLDQETGLVDLLLGPLPVAAEAKVCLEEDVQQQKSI